MSCNDLHEHMKFRGAATCVFRVLLCLVALPVIAVVLLAVGIGCPIRFTTGVACPGCGMTRAWLAVLSGDVPAAFAYHPLFWCVPLVLGLAVSFELAPRARRACTVVMAALVAAFALVWIVRLIDPADAGLLFSGCPPAGVPADIVSAAPPMLLRALIGR